MSSYDRIWKAIHACNYTETHTFCVHICLSSDAVESGENAELDKIFFNNVAKDMVPGEKADELAKALGEVDGDYKSDVEAGNK